MPAVTAPGTAVYHVPGVINTHQVPGKCYDYVYSWGWALASVSSYFNVKINQYTGLQQYTVSPLSSETHQVGSRTTVEYGVFLVCR